MPTGLRRYTLLVPTARSVTSPALFRTFRCCDTAGRLIGSSSASSPTARGRSARHVTMASLVGSPSASQPSRAWLVTTNGKLRLTVPPSQDRRAGGATEQGRALRHGRGASRDV